MAVTRHADPAPARSAATLGATRPTLAASLAHADAIAQIALRERARQSPVQPSPGPGSHPRHRRPGAYVSP
jgi:hypothetical protein